MGIQTAAWGGGWRRWRGWSKRRLVGDDVSDCGTGRAHASYATDLPCDQESGTADYRCAGFEVES